jgi:hypothetical protein
MQRGTDNGMLSRAASYVETNNGRSLGRRGFCNVYASAQGKPKATVVRRQSQKASVLLVATVSTTSFGAFAIELGGVDIGGCAVALSPSDSREGSCRRQSHAMSSSDTSRAASGT